jgi:hypothetical protein
MKKLKKELLEELKVLETKLEERDVNLVEREKEIHSFR